MEECQSDICPGLRGGICVVCADSMPSNNEVKNALGKPVPEHVYKCLVDLREAKRPVQSATIATMTANPASMGFAMF